jgi:hypothetical protein
MLEYWNIGMLYLEDWGNVVLGGWDIKCTITVGIVGAILVIARFNPLKN